MDYEDIDFYEEDLRDRKNKDEYYEDDPWEDYGENYDEDEIESEDTIID